MLLSAVVTLLLVRGSTARACDPTRYESSVAAALGAARNNASAAAEAFVSACTLQWTKFDIRKYVQNNWHAGEPTGASCGHLQRVGLYGDGGKMICDAKKLLGVAGKRPCHVISIGSNGESSFEQGIHSIAQHCSIDLFDGTLTGNRAHLQRRLPPYLNFFSQNVDASTWQQYQGTSSIRLLKMDCEGCEYDSLVPFVQNICVEQLLLETHLCSTQALSNRARVLKLHKMFLELDAIYKIFHVEPNLAYGDGVCVEYAFIRRWPCVDLATDNWNGMATDPITAHVA